MTTRSQPQPQPDVPVTIDAYRTGPREIRQLLDAERQSAPPAGLLLPESYRQQRARGDRALAGEVDESAAADTLRGLKPIAAIRLTWDGGYRDNAGMPAL